MPDLIFLVGSTLKPQVPTIEALVDPPKDWKDRYYKTRVFHSEPIELRPGEAEDQRMFADLEAFRQALPGCLFPVIITAWRVAKCLYVSNGAPPKIELSAAPAPAPSPSVPLKPLPTLTKEELGLRQAAEFIYRRYVTRYDGEVQGCCPVIASDIINQIGGEAVAGYLCFGVTRRPHWWVDLLGVVLDPMGDDLLSHEEFGHREEAHRDQEQFARILPEYEQWRVTAP